MTAQKLDGTATLRRRSRPSSPSGSRRSRSRASYPGSGTVLVGDDPGSHWYVGAKHKDCAEIGIESIRVDLPATATQAEVEAEIDRLNADPGCTGFLVQQPTGLDEFALLSRVDPDKDVDGLHPTNLGKLVLGVRPARCPARRSAASSCCAATASSSTAPRSSSSVAASPSAARWGCC